MLGTRRPISEALDRTNVAAGRYCPSEIQIATIHSEKNREQFMLADVGHILVVDDDPSLRQMVIRYLEDHNIPTKPA